MIVAGSRRDSVGVGWQYCDNVGKISNSQVAAFLSNGDFASMIDTRLYHQVALNFLVTSFIIIEKLRCF